MVFYGEYLVSFTGSGSAFFGIFRNVADVNKAKSLSWSGRTFVLRPVENSIFDYDGV